MKKLSKDSIQHLTGIIISLFFIIGGLIFGYFIIAYTEVNKLVYVIIGIAELALFGYLLYKSIIGFRKSLK